MPDGICLLKDGALIHACNARFHQLIGLPANAVRPGVDFSDVLTRQARRGDFGTASPGMQQHFLLELLAAEWGGCWTGTLPDGRVYRITCRPVGSGFHVLLCEPPTERTGVRDEAAALRELLEDEIAAREHLEQQYLANVEHLQLFVGNTPAAVAMLDRDLRYIFASQRWLENHGLVDASVVGKKYYELFPDVPERWKEVHRRVLSTGVGEQSEEDCILKSDGSREWSRWKVHPWLTSSGEIGGLILFSEVITERKRLEAQLLQAQRMEAVGQMTGGLAHDFNNLLTVVGGNLGFLREQLALDSDNTVLIDEALAAVRQGADLTRRLLTFSRDRETSPQVFNVGSAVTDLARLMQRTLPQGIRLDVVVHGGPWFCRIHRAEFESALLNLAINSRDAMPEGGHLQLEVTPDLEDGSVTEDFVCVRVRDTGTGMAPEVVEQATDLFFSTKEANQGTGLGLNRVQQFVSESRGRFEIDSQLGEGTTISLVLPRWQGSSEDQHPMGVGSEPPPRVADRGLLTERPGSIRESTVAMLDALGTPVDEEDPSLGSHLDPRDPVR